MRMGADALSGIWYVSPPVPGSSDEYSGDEDSGHEMKASAIGYKI
jgi:hypothetical protein